MVFLAPARLTNVKNKQQKHSKETAEPGGRVLPLSSENPKQYPKKYLNYLQILLPKNYLNVFKIPPEHFVLVQENP